MYVLSTSRGRSVRCWGSLRRLGRMDRDPSFARFRCCLQVLPRDSHLGVGTQSRPAEPKEPVCPR